MNVVDFISFVCSALAFIIFLRVILSWFLRPYDPIMVFFYRITEPALAPLRRIIPRVGMIDITPMVAIFILILIPQLLVRLT